jgi:hypothetical protein
MMAIFFGSFLGSLTALLFALAIVNIWDTIIRWRRDRADRQSLSRLAIKRGRR